MSLLPKYFICKNWNRRVILLLILPCNCIAQAQTGFLTKLPPEKRVQALWQYCSANDISDENPTVPYRFLTTAAQTADSLGDVQLKSYALYFRMCQPVIFSQRYEQHFAKGDYASVVAIFERAKAWAQREKHNTIMALCDYYIRQVYFRAGKYGAAFEYLLKGQEAFKKIGYKNIPLVSMYLYYQGLSYYRFGEWDKALDQFLTATGYPFYTSSDEISAYNSIGLIYERKKEWDKAALFYHKTIDKASACNNTTWVGITSGNLGNVFLQKGQNDSALFYHSVNYLINGAVGSKAPEDAALTSLAMATAFVRKHQPDSALSYIGSAKKLALASGKMVLIFLNFKNPFSLY